MRKFAALVPLSVVLLAAACQTGGAGEAEATPTDASPSPSPSAPVELDPAVPATAVFDLPAEVTENPEVAFPYLLPYENQSFGYDVAAEGLGPNDHIFITSYLLPEGTEYADYEASLAFIREYDALIVNDAHEASHDPALINGGEGIFRFAIIRDGDTTIYQRNFFVFDGNHVVHLSCQWENARATIGPACAEIQETFSLA